MGEGLGGVGQRLRGACSQDQLPSSCPSMGRCWLSHSLVVSSVWGAGDQPEAGRGPSWGRALQEAQAQPGAAGLGSWAQGGKWACRSLRLPHPRRAPRAAMCWVCVPLEAQAPWQDVGGVPLLGWQGGRGSNLGQPSCPSSSSAGVPPSPI